jgi:hypothetical protein
MVHGLYQALPQQTCREFSAQNCNSLAQNEVGLPNGYRRPRKSGGPGATAAALHPLDSRFRAGLSGESVARHEKESLQYATQPKPSCPALCRASTSFERCRKGVDGRDRPGQDDKRECRSRSSQPDFFPRTALRSRRNNESER